PRVGRFQRYPDHRAARPRRADVRRLRRGPAPRRDGRPAQVRERRARGLRRGAVAPAVPRSDQRRREVAGEFLRGPNRVSRRGRGDGPRPGTCVTPLPLDSVHGEGDGFRPCSIPFREVPMPTRSWTRKLFARPVTRPIRKAPRRARPVLEALEDRTVPSTFTVNNPTDMPAAGL